LSGFAKMNFCAVSVVIAAPEPQSILTWIPAFAGMTAMRFPAVSCGICLNNENNTNIIRGSNNEMDAGKIRGYF